MKLMKTPSVKIIEEFHALMCKRDRTVSQRSPQQSNIAGLDPEARRRLADRIGGVARAQVAVMLLDHAGIDVPQGRSDDHEWGAVHDGVRGECVASDVEVGGRADTGAPRGFLHLIVLI